MDLLLFQRKLLIEKRNQNTFEISSNMLKCVVNILVHEFTYTLLQCWTFPLNSTLLYNRKNNNASSFSVAWFVPEHMAADIPNIINPLF